MPLVGGGTVLQMIKAYRLIWISGRFGGGKTSLAFEIARNYAEDGYKIVTNSKSIWAENIQDHGIDENGHLNSVVILDEGGIVFKRNTQAEQIAAYANKMDIIFLIPSFWPPARKFRVLELQPIWNLTGIGIPYIQYQWRVSVGGFKDEGSFGWLFPQNIYGVYSRQDPGGKTDQIVDFLIREKDKFRAMHGADKIRKVGDDTMAGAQLFSDSVDAMEEKLDNFSSLLE